MFDTYTAAFLLRPQGEPGPQARFREELDRKPIAGRVVPVQRGRAVEIEGLVARNLQRVGHFIHLG